MDSPFSHRDQGPGHAELPAAYRALGQPAVVPGGAGRHCCHGTGRVLTRDQARTRAQGRDIARELGRLGISLQAARHPTVEEELAEAYRDAADAVEIVARAGLARSVAKLQPFVVVKG